MATRKTVGEPVQPTTHRGATFTDLARFLDEQMEHMLDGGWVKAWQYANGNTADGLRSRIRRGDMALPDEDGGERGRWDAKVRRIKKGERSGPAWVFVRYEGVKEDG